MRRIGRIACCAALAAAAIGAAEAQNRRWGALAFTADGSYSRAWGQATKAEAEAAVLKNCTGFDRGRCEVVAFDGALCAALASYRRAPNGPRHTISHTGGGATLAEARRKAVASCDADARTLKRCRIRTAICADGRR